MSKLPKYKMFVGGEWVAAVSGDWFESFDPYAGKPWALVARGAKDRSSGRDAATCQYDPEKT
jgi:acyl-CoA reductase-like NAD-dependent aldehyde dehydrogenase